MKYFIPKAILTLFIPIFFTLSLSAQDLKKFNELFYDITNKEFFIIDIWSLSEKAKVIPFEYLKFFYPDMYKNRLKSSGKADYDDNLPASLEYFFALYRVRLKENLMGYFIKTPEGENSVQIDFFIFDVITRKVLASYIVSSSGGDEGASHHWYSIFLDLDKDGIYDFLTVCKSEDYELAEDEHGNLVESKLLEKSLTLIVNLWYENRYKTFEITIE